MNELEPVRQTVARHKTFRGLGFGVGALLWFGGIALYFTGLLPRDICMILGFVAIPLFVIGKYSHQKLNSPDLMISKEERQRLISENRGADAKLKALSRTELIVRCEQFERDVSNGREPSANPYSGNTVSGSGSLSKLRSKNQELLRCLQRIDEPNLELLEKRLLARAELFGRIITSSVVILMASVVAERILTEMHLPKVFALLSLALGLIALCIGVGSFFVVRNVIKQMDCIQKWSDILSPTGTKSLETDAQEDSI